MTAVGNVVKKAIGKDDKLKGTAIPKGIEERLKRGREAMLQDAPKRRLCVKMWRGEQYAFVNHKNTLDALPTALNLAGGKPQHRIRNTYNFAHSIVEGKVSQATQRVPGYEVTPSTNDPEDWAASRLAGQIATYGYDKWRVRRATTKCFTNAFVQREGFAMPYFDANVGPFIETYTCEDCKKDHPGLGPCPSCGSEKDPVEEVIGEGEIKILTLSRSEVGWQPATDFDDSRWHFIQRAQEIDEVKDYPGFVGGTLVSDATTADNPTERKPSDNQVLVTEYFERPCPKYPRGRKLTIANDRVICPPEDYPCQDADGNVVDEPVLHRISYTVDPEGDDRGMVEHIIDLQRTINDCWSKLLEWKNRCLMPQKTAPRGSQMAPATDIPGAINYYNVVGGAKPEWERTPQVPRELFDMLELAIQHMRAIASDVDVQADPDVAARTANAAIEHARARWQSFLGDAAEWHSRLMRHCLVLVARHYTEERQVEIRGQYDWAMIPDFTGQDLRSQVNVRVLPGSIETKGRQQVMEELTFVQTNWPNAISPEAAIAILHGGNADELLKSPQYDIARAARMVKLLQQGMEALEQTFQPVLRPMPGPPDPLTGMSTTVMQEVPGWMPRKQDNIAIYKQVVGDFMKTPLYEQLEPEKQEMFNLFWSGLEFSEQQRAIEQAQLEVRTAQDLGMANAAKPQGEVQQPSPPGPAEAPPQQ